MALGGNKLNLQRQRLYIPVTQFTGLLPGFTVTKGAILASSELGLSADDAAATVNNNTIAATLTLPNIVTVKSALGTFATAPELGEISTTGLVGLKMNTAGDKVSHLMQIPNDWDRYRPIYVRVAWTSGSSTDADTIDWIYTHYVHAEGTTAALSTAEVAISTAIAQDTVGTAAAFAVMETANGVINGGVLTNSASNRWYKFSIEMDAFAAGLTEDKYLLGVSFEYSPQLGKGISDQESSAARFGQYS